MEPDRQLAIYLSAFNAETFDRLDEPTADEDGHVVTATVLRRADATSHSMIPVRVRVAHGVAGATAESMLRKIADLIASNPDVLSAEPGTALRRLPDGGAIRKRITPESIAAAAELLGEEDRRRLIAMLDQIRPQITDEQEDL